MLQIILLGVVVLTCAVAGIAILVDLFRPASMILGPRFNALSATIRGFVGSVLLVVALLLGISLSMVNLP
jgi:hypothetical protein